MTFLPFLYRRMSDKSVAVVRGQTIYFSLQTLIHSGVNRLWFGFWGPIALQLYKVNNFGKSFDDMTYLDRRKNIFIYLGWCNRNNTLRNRPLFGFSA